MDFPKRKCLKIYISVWAMVMFVLRNKNSITEKCLDVKTVLENKKDMEPNSSDTKGTLVNTAE